MRYKPNLPEAVERMRRLWNLEEPLDRVPCAVMLPSPPPPPGKELMADGTFFGDPEGFVRWREEAFRRQAEVPDEWLPIVYPRFGHALISALLGSPAVVKAETTWSIPFLDDWSQVDDLRINFDCDWGQRYLRELEFMLDWAEGRCAVPNYEIEGVSDTMAALRGTQRLAYDFYDSPDEARRFAKKVADLLIEWGRWQQEHIPARQDLLGGVGLDWAIWAPANSVAIAEDATVLWNRELYQEFVQEEDRRLTAAFNYTMLEVHAEGNHQIPEFGEVTGFTMLTIENPLHMKPAHQEMVRALLGKKAFYTGCAPAEVEDLLAFTGTRGVFLVLSAANAAEAQALLGDLKRWTAEHRR